MTDPNELIATASIIDLPVGNYTVTVTGGAAQGPLTGSFSGSALQISAAPVASAGSIELESGPGCVDRWLRRAEDYVSIKIHGRSASVLLTSVRMADSPAMSIDIRRNQDAGPELFDGEWEDEETVAPLVPLDVLAHIQRLGDVEFDGGPVCSPTDDLWIEGFAIRAPGRAIENILEYCAIRADGILTPWLEGGIFCGSRGTGRALVGFALRIQAAFTSVYECAYSARFASGTSCEWLHEGALCQSDLPNDALLSMEVKIFDVSAKRSPLGDAGEPRTAGP